ncbi:MAG: phosphonoacetaldehyde hydrolase [Campylobacterales bacterium]|nr:phosphonoacetaldehyde hydrolase [Campylobacterales bacterium]
MAKITGVICDWAGTTVDFGSLSPVAAFAKAFEAYGHTVSFEEIRTYMGMLKYDHTLALLEHTKERFRASFGRLPAPEDAKAIYGTFETALFETLADYAVPIKGAVAFAQFLHEEKIHLGSTTGYTPQMMEIVAPEAAKHGFMPAAIIAPRKGLLGRPHPYLIYQNAIMLGCYPLWRVVKIGDTVSDMQEGRNAGCWCVGVSVSGNEMGLSEADVAALDTPTYETKKARAVQTLETAGAHLVIDGIWHAKEAIERIERWIQEGHLPHETKETLCN